MKSKSIKIVDSKILSDSWSVLKQITFDYQKENGIWERQSREVYDRGDGAVILLYNKQKKTVILTKQFRLTTYMNGNDSGMLIEACAGMLEENNPETCIKQEAEEETGYHISEIEKIFEAYMTPGSVTEILYFFIAAYEETMKLSKGGGLKEEQEHIEVLEIAFEEALHMITSGAIKDAKTIMLLQYLKINSPF